MAKITTAAVFKPYQPDQPQLLPQSLDEFIADNHLVRVIRRVVDQMDLSAIINMYPGGGSSSYHPKMMISVLLYAYSIRLYTGRKIAQALRQDITFMWLSGRNMPGFRTLNQFRSGVLKGSIEELFSQMLEFLIDHSYVSFEDYFVDGSSFGADANRHKMVWRKKAERYKRSVAEKCKELFEQIDKLNEKEDERYGEADLEETGSVAATLTQDSISKQVERLNEVIKTTTSGKTKRQANGLQKKVQKQSERLHKYNEQLNIAGDRSGYSKTDPDAVAMHMKNKETLPAYNVLIGTEDQYILNYSVHQTPSDSTAFPEHLEQLDKHATPQPKAINGDAGFGSEQNYELIEKREIENYVKYNTFHHEQTRKHKANRFHKDNFPYDPNTDTFICPNERQLTYHSTIKKTNPRTGFVSTLKIYECTDCSNCPFAAECKKSHEKNRTLQVNENYEKFKKQARDNLLSEKGISLRKRRGHEVESVFGDLKKNQLFRRFHLRGKQKVKTEFGILAIAHNLRKIHSICLKKAS